MSSVNIITKIVDIVNIVDSSNIEQSVEENSPRKPYHHGNLRNALIVAAQELLIEEGVAGLDLRKVARRAGVSHNAPYRHFADKKALLATLAQLGFEKLELQMKAALEQISPQPLEQLRSMMREYVLFGLDNPAYIREMFSGLTIARAEYPALYAASKAIFRLIVEIVERGQDQHTIRPGEPQEITITLWSLMHGLTMLLVEDQIPDAKTNPAIIQHLTASCLQSLFSGVEDKANE